MNPAAEGESTVDLSPRTIWLGLTIPGKKMVRIVQPGGDRGRALIDLYQGGAHMALLAAAFALDRLPEHGALGPALRDLAKPLTPSSLFGATLTDIRDFLRFRFRVSHFWGLDLSEFAFGADFDSDSAQEAREAIREDPGLTIAYVINALNALSKDREGTVDVRLACGSLSQLLRLAAKSLVGEDRYAILENTLYGRPLDEN